MLVTFNIVQGQIFLEKVALHLNRNQNESIGWIIVTGLPVLFAVLFFK